MTIGLYAGSFDPPTRGHLWMIEQAAKICTTTLYVAVGTNPTKTPMFTAEERLNMLRRVTWWGNAKRVEDGSIQFVELPAHRFTVQEAIDRDCDFLIRGIRSNVDLDGEWAQRVVNDDIAQNYTTAPHVPTTIFLMPPPQLTVVSSSMVKSLIGIDGWESYLEKYVMKSVLTQIKKKVNK